MSRSELKENLLAARMEQLVRWGLVRRVPILISAGFVLVAFMIGSVIVLRRQQQAEVAETQLAIAQQMIMQQHSDQAVPLLQSIRPKVSDRALLTRVLYMEGTAYINLKKFPEAVSVLQEAVGLAAGSPIQPLVLSNLGFAQEQGKSFQDAAATYGRFMTDHGNHFLAPRIQLLLGRSLFAAGKPEDARKALGQLIDLYPTSTWAQNARALMAQHP